MLNSLSIYSKNSLILIIILAIALGALPVFSLGSAIMFTIIGLVGLVLYVYLPKENRRFLIRLYVASFAVRFLLLVVTYFISAHSTGRGEISPDSRYYTIYALELSRQWRGGDIIAATSEMHGINWHTYILATFYTLVNYGAGSFSPNPMFSDKLINVLVGTLSVIFIFYITKEIFGKKVANLASLLVAFWPSLILWSITNLREPINILLTSIVFWGILQFYKTHKPKFIFIVFVSLICFIGIRPYLFLLVLIITIFSLYIFLPLKKSAKILLFIGLIGFFILSPRLMSVLEEKINKYFKEGDSYSNPILNMNRNIIAQGGSAYEIYDEDVIINNKINCIKLFKGFLKGWFYFMLVPFPWAITSMFQILFYPLILAWYSLLFFSFLGIFWALRYRFSLSFSLISYLFIVTSAYALVEGNVGSAMRHRDLVLPFFLIFAAASLVKLFDKGDIYS